MSSRLKTQERNKKKTEKVGGEMTQERMQEEKVIKGDRTQEKANIPYEMRRLRG
jgi:hypothetical protein